MTSYDASKTAFTLSRNNSTDAQMTITSKRVTFCTPLTIAPPLPAAPRSTARRVKVQPLPPITHRMKRVRQQPLPASTHRIQATRVPKTHAYFSDTGLLTADINVAGFSVSAIVDTGASTSYMSLGSAKQLGLLRSMQPSSGSSNMMADGSKSSNAGIVHGVSVTFGSTIFTTTFVIGCGKAPLILLGSSSLRQARFLIDFENLCLRSRIDQSTTETIPVHVHRGSKSRLVHACAPPSGMPAPTLTREFSFGSWLGGVQPSSL